jgi:hypothetical protein
MTTQSDARRERFKRRHPMLHLAIVGGGGFALCVAFPFAYEALRGWVH